MNRQTLAQNALLTLLLVLALIPLAQAFEDSPAFAAEQQAAQDPAVAQKVARAEGYHDLAVLYLKKGEPEKAAEAARQIVQLRLPADYEDRVAKSISIITERLARADRFDLGHFLLDEALRGVSLPATRAKLLRNKARLYVLAGDDDRAIETWQQALEMESPRIR